MSLENYYFNKRFTFLINFNSILERARSVQLSLDFDTATPFVSFGSVF